MVTKKASGKPTSTTRAASKSASDATEAPLSKRPPQEPIIIGGGSVFMEFDKKFKVKNHPNKPNKHKAEHEDTTVGLVKALIYDCAGNLTTTIRLDPKGKVVVCYTGSDCPA